MAMRGWIMPTPLAMPETVTLTGDRPGPAAPSEVVASLIFVSVVIIAPATAARASSVEASSRDQPRDPVADLLHRAAARR